MARATTRWGRLVSAVANLALGLLVAWATYVVAVAIVLSPWGMRKIFAGSNDIKLDRLRGWSVWPGVVHVYDVRIRMQDPNVEFSLDIAQADVTVALTDLARRTFHATKVRGSGAAFRFRSRVLPEDAHSPSVAGYPPIPPYDDPPISPPHARPPPIPEADYRLWSVHMEDVDMGVSEAWLHEARYVAGPREARARGAFRLRPAKSLWVGPATLDLAPGDVSIRGLTVLGPISGHAECTITPFDVHEPKGMEVLAFVDVVTSMTAQVHDLAVLSAYLPHGVRVEDGSGQVKAHVVVEHGVLGGETSVHYETSRIRAVAPQGSVEAPLEAWLRVAPDDYEAGRAYVRSPRVVVHRPEVATPLVIAHLVAEASSTSVALTAHGELAGARIEIGDARATDARWLAWPSFRPGGKPFEPRGGPVSVRGGVALSADHRLSGALDAAAVVSTVTVVDETLSGSLHALARFEHVTASPLAGSAHVTVAGTGLTLMDPSGILVAVPNVDASAAVHLGSAHSRRATLALDASGATLSTARALGFGAKTVSVRAEGETDRDGALSATVTGTIATALARRPTSSARGNASFTLRLRATPDLEHVTLTGGVRVANVALRTPKKAVDGWSAAIDVTSARVDRVPARKGAVSGTVVGVASVAVRLRDGTPLLAVLAAEDELPAWIGDVLPEAPVIATARVRFAEHRLDLVVPRAVAGPLLLSGCVARANRGFDGALLVALSGTPLAVGLGVEGGAVHVAPLVGEGWLREHGGTAGSGAVCSRRGVDAPRSPEPVVAAGHAWGDVPRSAPQLRSVCAESGWHRSCTIEHP